MLETICGVDILSMDITDKAEAEAEAELGLRPGLRT
jgi:hypothetical protein